MKFVDIAQEIIDESSELTNTQLPIITSWLRNNIGKLNTLINTTYAVNSDTMELDTDLSDAEKAIFKQIYIVGFYQKKTEQNLGALAYDVVMELTSDGKTIRKVNRNEIAKTYAQLKRDAKADLDDLVAAYKLRSENTDPKAVSGTDGDVVILVGNPEYYIRTRKPE